MISEYLVDTRSPTAYTPVRSTRWSMWGSGGRPVILSDGDVVFQAAQGAAVRVCGDAVEGRVLIYIHKELMLDDVEGHYPARRYVMVDDKLRILAAMKNVWGDRLTTVFRVRGITRSTARPSPLTLRLISRSSASASWRIMACRISGECGSGRRA